MKASIFYFLPIPRFINTTSNALKITYSKFLHLIKPKAIGSGPNNIKMGMVIKGRQVLIIQVAIYFLLLLSASNYCCESCGVGEEKVKLDIYYETLCPSSAKFIVDNLPTLFHTGLIHVTHLKLLPYGNANLYNGTIYCQVSDQRQNQNLKFMRVSSF